MERRRSPVLQPQVRAGPTTSVPWVGGRDFRHSLPLPAMSVQPGIGRGTRSPTAVPTWVGAGTLDRPAIWQRPPATRGVLYSMCLEPAAPNSLLYPHHFTPRAPEEGKGEQRGRSSPRTSIPPTQHPPSCPRPAHRKAQDTPSAHFGDPPPFPCSWLFIVPAIYFPWRRKSLGWSFTAHGSVSAPRDLAFWTEMGGSTLSSGGFLRSQEHSLCWCL